MGKTPDLGQQAEALRELVREANGTLGDLRRTIKEARDVAPAIVKDHLNKAVTEGLAELGEKTAEAMRRSVEKVNAEFDKLADILLGRTAECKATGKRSIPELVAEMTREPEVVEDPRELGGTIVGSGGPHDHGKFTFDVTKAVLADRVEVATAEEAEDGTPDRIALVLAGRVNGSRDRARVLYFMDEDGAATLVTEIEALMRRGARDGWADRYQKAKAQREARLRAAGTWE